MSPSVASTAGLENLTNTLVSSADHRLTVNEPPALIRRWVTAVLSTPTPTSTGSIETWVTQLVVIAFHSSPARGPDEDESVGDLPGDGVQEGSVDSHHLTLGWASA